MRHLTALTLLLALGACTPIHGATNPAGPEQSLADARARWRAAGVTDYSFTVSRSCFCPPEFIGPFRVTVRDGAVTGVTREGAPVDTAQVPIPTVEGMFDEIEAAIDAGAAEVRVAYESTLGYPSEMWIDQDRMMADEETGYSISAFSRN